LVAAVLDGPVLSAKFYIYLIIKLAVVPAAPRTKSLRIFFIFNPLAIMFLRLNRTMTHDNVK